MNIPYCLRRARQYHGNCIAIHHNDRKITYREFAESVEGSARKLISLGVHKGDRVAVLMLNSPEYLDLYYSIPLAGAIIVPLNTRWDCRDVAFALSDSGSKMLFIDDRLAAMAPQIRDALPGKSACLFAGTGDSPAGLLDWRTVQPNRAPRFEEPDENDIAGLFYTSGTTGGPKGAMLTHRNLYANAIHGMLPPLSITSDWVYLHAAPMFHLADAGAVYGLTLIGSTHCFIPAFDPEAVLKAIEQYRITGVVLVPAMLNMVLNHPKFNDHDLSSLRRITYGASPMPLPLLREAMEKLHCDFVQGYGMTELSPLLTILAPADHTFKNCAEQFAPVKSAGKPVIGTEVRVVDNQDRDVAAGEVGEVIARGPNVMKGYWNRPEITAEVLRGGWMHTGDLGAFDQEGFIYILDRKKDMIKTGSENVFSPEVESLICAHPAVLEAAVIGVPDAKWGESIRAVVVVRPGGVLSERELIEWCRERLTHFKCPTSVVFTDALPKGGTGKVQKTVLRERFASVSSRQ